MRKVIIVTTLSVVLTGCAKNLVRQEFSKLDPNENYCKVINQPSYGGLKHQLQAFGSKIDRLTGIQVLEEGNEAIATRAWLSDAAEYTIDVQYFIFSMDNVGLIALDYLVQAADRGVKVRILVDDFMVDADERFILEIANHPNIDIKVYNPTTNIGKSFIDQLESTITNFRGVNQRMHNKTFIVDGSAVITGGRNIADEYFDYSRKYNFRDRDILLIGKGSDRIQ